MKSCGRSTARKRMLALSPLSLLLFISLSLSLSLSHVHEQTLPKIDVKQRERRSP